MLSSMVSIEVKHSSPMCVAMSTIDSKLVKKTFLSHLFALWYCMFHHDEKRNDSTFWRPYYLRIALSANQYWFVLLHKETLSQILLLHFQGKKKTEIPLDFILPVSPCCRTQLSSLVQVLLRINVERFDWTMVQFAQVYSMLGLDKVNNLGQKQKDNEFVLHPMLPVSALSLR